MTEINKDEILKPSKWARFIFMFGYAFVLNLLLPIYIGLAFIQFLFFLVTSKPNTSIQKFNSSMVEFFSDTLRFLLFGTDEKPFPFKMKMKNLQITKGMMKMMWLKLRKQK